MSAYEFMKAIIVVFSYCLLQLNDVRAKISNIGFFLKILLLKDDELVMSEM